MSTVMFHSVCDKCGKESVEYTAYAWCKECGDDVCPDCMDKPSYDPETCIALCIPCAEELRKEEAASNSQFGVGA
jgi:hypothetical protein